MNKLQHQKGRKGQKIAQHNAHAELHKHQRNMDSFAKLTKIVCKSIRILTVLFEIPPLKSVKFFLKKMRTIKSENSGHSKISEEDFEGSYKCSPDLCIFLNKMYKLCFRTVFQKCY